MVCFGHKGLQQELRASALLPLPCCCLPATACLQVEAPKPKAEPTAVLKAPAAKQQTAQAEKMTESKQAEEKAEETGRRLGMNMALGLGLLGSSLALPFGLYVLICQRTAGKRGRGMCVRVHRRVCSVCTVLCSECVGLHVCVGWT